MKPVKASAKSVLGQNVFASSVLASSAATFPYPMNNSESVFEILCRNHERSSGKDKEDSPTEFTDVGDLYAQLKETIALVNELKLENSELKAKCSEKNEKLAGTKSLFEMFQRELQEKLGQLELNDGNAEETKKEKQWDVAELTKFLLEIKREDRKLVNTLEDFASKAYREEKYNEALQHYKNAIEMEISTSTNSDKLADLYLWKAHVHFYLKQYSYAISNLHSALDYRYNCLFSLKLLAKVEIESRAYFRAKDHLNEILAKDRYDVEARYLLDIIQEKMYGTGNGKLFDDEVAVEYDFDHYDYSYSDSGDGDYSFDYDNYDLDAYDY